MGKVLVALAELNRKRNYAATTYELFQFMALPDLNHVRPRATELKKEGYIQQVGKRKCEVTGRKVLIWELTDKGHQALGALKAK